MRRCFTAYASDQPEVVEAAITDGFTFSSPADPGLDRDACFARCWPNTGRIVASSLVRMIEGDAEVVATYEAQRSDGGRFRNTEVFTFRGDLIDRQEVYFGWDLPA